VSAPIVSTSRSPRGLNRPRGSRPGIAPELSKPYSGSSGANGKATCVSEKTSGGHANPSSRRVTVNDPGSAVRVSTSRVSAERFVTTTRRYGRGARSSRLSTSDRSAGCMNTAMPETRLTSKSTSSLPLAGSRS
jgi:hypothetical protein